MKIISGGQTGADRAALEIAKQFGIETGGWAPKGYLTENGPDLSLKDFGLQEHPSYKYPPRTFANVRDSHATVWFGVLDFRGYKCTLRAIEQYGRPFLNNPNAYTMRQWMKTHDLHVINVAGTRGSKNPEIVKKVQDVLSEVFRTW